MNVTEQCNDSAPCGSTPCAFHAGLCAIAEDRMMLRSRFTSRTADWAWEDLPADHTLVGTVRTVQEIGPYWYMSVWELDATGSPVRSFDMCSRSECVDYVELIATDATRGTARKWSAEGGRLTCDGTVVANPFPGASIPRELDIRDGAGFFIPPRNEVNPLDEQRTEWVREVAEVQGAETATGDAWRESLVEDLRAALEVCPDPVVSDVDTSFDASMASAGLTMATIERQRQGLSRDFHKDYYNSEYLRVRALDEDLLGPAPPPAE